MKLQEIINSTEALRKLSEMDLPSKTSFKIMLIVKELDTYLKPFEEARNNLIKKHGTVIKDKDGKETDQYKIDPSNPETIEVFNKEMTDLLNEEIELKSKKIKIDEISDLKIKPKDLMQLEFIFEA